MISEFPLGSRQEAEHFSYRSSVISGRSLCVVAIEAAEKSGSLNTARCATEQNGEAFAVPGNITASRSPQQLIEQCAELVEGTEDILPDIEPTLMSRVQVVQPDSPPGTQDDTLQASCPRAVTVEADEALLVDMFDGEPLHVDTLTARSQLGPALTLDVLVGLELQGTASQLPGTRMIRAG